MRRYSRGGVQSQDAACDDRRASVGVVPVEHQQAAAWSDGIGVSVKRTVDGQRPGPDSTSMVVCVEASEIVLPFK